MERQIQQTEIVQAGVDALRNSLYVCMPGSVVSYHAESQTADVQPMTNDVRVDLDTGAVVFEPWSIIRSVPVVWPRFGGFVIAGSLAANDPVILEAWDLDPGPWRAQGRSSRPANPVDTRRLGGNYWRAVPSDLTGPMQDAGAAATMTIVGVDGDAAQIRFSKGVLQLGNQGTDFVALASLVKGELSKIQATLLTGAVPGPAAVTFATPYMAGSVASSLIKAQ
jgi:hypothetical protein